MTGEIGGDCQQPAGEATQAVRQDRGRLEGQGGQPHAGAGALPARLPRRRYRAVPRAERSRGVPEHAGRGEAGEQGAQR